MHDLILACYRLLAWGLPEELRRACLADMVADLDAVLREEDERRGVWGVAWTGLRALLRRPGFAGIATLTLGLGIGATVAISTVVNAPGHEPARHRLGPPGGVRAALPVLHGPATDRPRIRSCR